MRWPKGIDQPNRECNDLVGQIDILATLAEITGTKLPDTAGEDSHSWAKALSNPQATLSRPPLINHSVNGGFSITEKDWKFVFPHRKIEAALYDLSEDPGETNNISKDHPDIVKDLKTKATDIVRNGRTTAGPNHRMIRDIGRIWSG